MEIDQYLHHQAYFILGGGFPQKSWTELTELSPSTKWMNEWMTEWMDGHEWMHEWMRMGVEALHSAFWKNSQYEAYWAQDGMSVLGQHIVYCTHALFTFFCCHCLGKNQSSEFSNTEPSSLTILTKRPTRKDLWVRMQAAANVSAWSIHWSGRAVLFPIVGSYMPFAKRPVLCLLVIRLDCRVLWYLLWDCIIIMV